MHNFIEVNRSVHILNEPTMFLSNHSSSLSWLEESSTNLPMASDLFTQLHRGMNENQIRTCKRAHIILRVLYIVSACTVITAAILAILSGLGSLGNIFIIIYTMFLSCLLCCTEMGLPYLSRLSAVNFGFLYTLIGRIIFVCKYPTNSSIIV